MATDTLPRLSRALLRSLRGRGDLRASLPDESLLDLPEKAVQFGTGAFLRGFVDYFVDEANRRGVFGGRVVMVGSTGSGRDQALTEQDGLYTLSVQGIEGGEVREEHRVVASVSRALSAKDEWDAVLACARTPELELVFSNTTEVGIALDEADGDPEAKPPRSFPGKLTRFLYERGHAFGFAPARGVVVIPCELIEANGGTLKEIVLALAERWKLDPAFARWVRESVPFCNTLVDRIVPGAPTGEQGDALRRTLGWRDELHTTCEVYRLFAIEADAATLKRLARFASADPGIILTEDVRPYRERKVRLLNAAHTIMVPAAILTGLKTVREAVEDETIGPFLRRVLFDEIVPTVDVPGADAFARDVMDRFANPYIRHALVDITLQGTMKMRVRVVPIIVRYAERVGHAPPWLAFGFAANLLWMTMRAALEESAVAAGGKRFPADDQAHRVLSHWSEAGAAAVPRGGESAVAETALPAVVRSVCADTALWGHDLTTVPGFADGVTQQLVRIYREGVADALDAQLSAAGSAR